MLELLVTKVQSLYRGVSSSQLNMKTYIIQDIHRKFIVMFGSWKIDQSTLQIICHFDYFNSSNITDLGYFANFMEKSCNYVISKISAKSIDAMIDHETIFDKKNQSNVN